MVASNYSAKYTSKTFENMKRFQGGNAIFNMPTMPIKCPGAPQKIMYLADDFWRQAREGGREEGRREGGREGGREEGGGKAGKGEGGRGESCSQSDAHMRRAGGVPEGGDGW